MPGVHHGGVAARAEVRVVVVELLVSEVEKVTLGVVESREHLRVDFSVSFSQLPVEVWAALTGELAVKDENVPPLLTVRAVERGGGEGGGREEGREEVLLLSVLPVLRPSDVAALELEAVASVNNPDIIN